MSKKIKVGVLLGGSSSERKISLITGRAVFDNLDNKKYKVNIIEMTKDGRFFVFLTEKRKRLLDLQNKDRKLFDIIFIALHGSPGEDGTIQGMLELLKIPFTGSDTLSSALAMNKVLAGKIYKINNLPHPNFISFTEMEWGRHKTRLTSKITEFIRFPAVIKPVNEGSAIGVQIVRNKKEMVETINKTIKKFKKLMIQEFIEGKEATCGVLEKNGSLITFPPTEIIPKLNSFYDFKSKYKKNGSKHICPSQFGAKINKEIQLLALKSHKALGCRGMSRTDVFVKKDGKIFVIETNTIPGMTPTSLFPESAKIAGISFKDMLDSIIRASL